jgi:arylsulfatase B
LRPETPHGIMTSVPTIAEKLKKRGYSTHIIGKWHLGFCKPAYLPTNRGFQHHYGFWGGAQDYFNHEVLHAYDFREDLKVKPAAKGTYSTEIISQHNQSNPLFLFVPFQSVHELLQVPKRTKLEQNFLVWQQQWIMLLEKYRNLSN